VEGFAAKSYHAGLDAAVRSRHQNLFLRDEVKIIVATIAFGMGINKSNVRFVVHMDLPKNIESYYQETGRAGRDGLLSEALLFYSPADVRKLSRFATVEGNEEQSAVMLRKLKQLSDFCEANVCRRHALLRYFGEEFPTSCESCDVCLSERKTFDGTVIAQKLLSAVYRLGERFGLGYTIDFLRGSKSEKIRGGHRAMKTFGAGADISKEKWLRYAKDLIALGFLKQIGEPYPILSLTEKSAAVLRGEIKVMLTESVETKEAEPEAPRYEQALFERLKALRMETARAENVPPYLVFSDATLIELATFLPTTLAELTRISGFGEVKVARYGKKFLEAIAEYMETSGITSRMSESYRVARVARRKNTRAIPNGKHSRFSKRGSRFLKSQTFADFPETPSKTTLPFLSGPAKFLSKISSPPKKSRSSKRPFANTAPPLSASSNPPSATPRPTETSEWWSRV
jgi:ATP-dependent DNA helicase RecQ